MQARWKDFEEIVDRIAHATHRKWMTGIVDFDDVKQEIWAAFFDIYNVNPDASRTAITQALKDFSVKYKREESDRKFGKRLHITISKSDINSGEEKWKKIHYVWEEYLKKIPRRESILLRYVALGCTENTISVSLGITTRMVRYIKQKMLQNFKNEVENNLDIEKEF